jgi:hypothetical protein
LLVPDVVESVPDVPVCPLMLPDVPVELPLRLRFERDLLVVELVVLLLFWSIVVLDWPVCDALDCPVPSVPVALAPEPFEL